MRDEATEEQGGTAQMLQDGWAYGDQDPADLRVGQGAASQGTSRAANP